MALSLEVRKITVQKDKLVSIDAENFELDRFKRALVDAEIQGKGRSSEIKLVVDLRARIMTISCKGSDLTAGRIGMAILVEYARTSGDFTVLDKISEDPSKMPTWAISALALTPSGSWVGCITPSRSANLP